MVNYADGKIYKITCNTTGLCYIGSTCGTLAKRIAQHANDYTRFKSGTFHFITSFKVIENNNYIIELVELVACDNKTKLHIRERFHIENTVCVNKQIAGSSQLENRQIYKDNNREKIKQYYIDNRIKLKEYKRLRYLKLKAIKDALKIAVDAIVAI